jgi:hypothetical protein
MSRPRLIVCSGLELPKTDPLREGRHVVQLDTLDDEGNVNLHIENVTRAFARNVPDRVVDLLEIAAYVFAADCSARREGAWTNDETEEPWGRDFHFVVPVRDLDFWERDEVQSTLVGALRFMSSDTFGFAFRRLSSDRPLRRYLEQPYLPELGDPQDSPFYEAERVVMFSGGLDSLAGAVETAARGQPLVAVSHRPAPHVSTLQTGLMQQLRALFPGPIRHIPVWVNKHGLDSEATQRTRAFLFSALGVAVASALHAGGVRFYENGVTSLNWPVTQEVLQSRATRSTHPLTLQRLQEFYRLLTERLQFAIDNPFVFKTKAEVISRIAAAGVPELIGLSASCVYTRRQASGRRHCGVCRQCLDRRIAVLAAGQEASERAEDYRSDVFTGPRQGDYDHNIAVGYARQATDLDQMDVADIGFRYDRELALAVRCYEHQAEVAERFIDLHKRHAAAVCAVIAEQVRAHSAEFVAGTIDKSSLLGMVGGQEHSGQIVVSTKEAEAERVAATPQADQNVFLRAGDMWTVTYEKVTDLIGHSKGMQYVACLLAHQGRQFTPIELVWLVNGEPDATQSAIPTVSEEERLDGDLHPVIGTGEQVLPGRYGDEIRRQIREFDQELAKAQRDGDPVVIEYVKKEKQEFMKKTAGGLGRRNQSRTFDAGNEAARKLVSHHVNAAVKKISDAHPALGEHLRIALLPVGSSPCYTPGRPIVWLT